MDPNEKLIKNLVLSGFSLIGATIIVNQLMKKRLKPFKKVGIVKRLFIYPIKSLPGIELDSLDFTDQEVHWKLLKDRAFMLVNRLNVMITLRQEPSLIKLRVTLDYPNREIIVSTPDGSKSIKLSIDYDKPSDVNVNIIETDVWGNKICGVDCGPEVSEFFSKYLNKPEIKLIQFVSGMRHRPAEIYREGRLYRDEKLQIMYHDTSTCHLINTKSVDTLNGWINNPDEKMTFANFRPNILIEADSFAEENWQKIKIGDETALEWQQLLKCVRCRVPTVHQEKAIFLKEPLATLKGLNRPLAKKDLGYANNTDPKGRPQAPLMGIFFKPDSPGTIKVNQDVWASNKHGFFWFL